MRTALILLFLLAVAAIPGSVLPQRGVNPEKVNAVLRRPPRPGPAARPDRRLRGLRLGLVLRDLPAAVHLAGRLHPAPAAGPLRALRSRPPAAPKRLDRLPAARRCWTRRPPPTRRRSPPCCAAAAGGSRSAATRSPPRRATSRRPATCSSTSRWSPCCSGSRSARGTAGTATGCWWPARTTRFCNTRQQYDEAYARPAGGQRRPAAVLPAPWTTSTRGSCRPASRPAYRATVTVDEPDGAERHRRLLGQLAAAARPRQRLPARPRVRPDPPVHRPVRPQPDQHRAVPDHRRRRPDQRGRGRLPGRQRRPEDRQARPPNQQVAFDGLYLPTAPDTAPFVSSKFPDGAEPGGGAGRVPGQPRAGRRHPRSVYKLDQRQVDNGKLKQVGDKKLGVGEKWTLDDGSTLEFVGTKPYVTLSVRYDPGADADARSPASCCWSG